MITFDLIKTFEIKLQIFYRDVIFEIFKYLSNTIFVDLESQEKPDHIKLTQVYRIQGICRNILFHIQIHQQKLNFKIYYNAPLIEDLFINKKLLRSI